MWHNKVWTPYGVFECVSRTQKRFFIGYLKATGAGSFVLLNNPNIQKVKYSWTGARSFAGVQNFSFRKDTQKYKYEDAERIQIYSVESVYNQEHLLENTDDNALENILFKLY